jgi:hypothetical protein
MNIGQQGNRMEMKERHKLNGRVCSIGGFLYVLYLLLIMMML